MGYVPDNSALRLGILGALAQKPYTLAVETKTLFNVTGLVAITSIIGVVTTSITVANTVKLQANPTVGTTGDLCAATDLGTTDTLAGSLLSVPGAPTGSIIQGVGTVPLWPISKVTTDFLGAPKAVVVNAGTIEQVTTGAGVDGVVTWYLTWHAITNGASVAAA